MFYRSGFYIANIAALLLGADTAKSTLRLPDIRYQHGRHAAHGPGRGVSPSYTKRGPGRRYRGGSTKFNRPQQRRKYPLAQYGGNWQGVEYLSSLENDRLVRLTRLGGIPAWGVHCNISRDQALEIIRAKRP